LISQFKTQSLQCTSSMDSETLSNMGHIYVTMQTSLSSTFFSPIKVFLGDDRTIYRFFTRITEQMRRRLEAYKETIEASLADLLCFNLLTVLYPIAN